MEATIVNLRYNMREVLNALDRNETVSVLHHGKKRGILLPTPVNPKKINETDFFGMCADEKETVSSVFKKIRGGRYCDL